MGPARQVTTTQKQAPLPGTRPEGSRDEREAAARIRDMFTRIVPRYDFLNHLLSLSLDHLWRRRAAKRFLPILRRPDARILDLCCGTGDLAFALDRARASVLAGALRDSPQMPEPRSSGVSIAGPLAGCFPIVGSDFVEPMLVRAREKANVGHRAVVLLASDALHLPFPDASFDLLTLAFGFRNLANYEAGLREFARVLKRGGELGILEFTEPSDGLMAGLFRFYFKNILPRIGAAISGNAQAYQYLPGSVSRFPSPPELSRLIEQCGFRDVRTACWNFGSVVLHWAPRG
jgi:demethylmenaquinone methyltransferase / 2-methoxy-6-polyprenyl-1,4-benzoquinol methylase